MRLQVGLVAAQLYPADAPLTHQPFRVAGDGNCFFRAASLALTGCTEGEHVKLRKQVAQELQHNAISIASSIVAKAKFCACNMKTYSLLVGSMLHDDTLDTFTSTMDCGSYTVEESLSRALVEEGKKTVLDGRWCGIHHIWTLANDLKRPIYVHYPEVNKRIRPFFNTFVQPIHIMWSSLSLPISLQGNVELNHFVPLLPMSSVDQSEGFTEGRGRKRKLSETLPRSISSTASLSKNIRQYDDTSRKTTSPSKKMNQTKIHNTLTSWLATTPKERKDDK